MKQYNKSNIPLAKKLRKEMTPWERKLWYDYLRYYPVRFQRQKAIGEYIADFYCAKARLVVELDGGGHYEEAQILKDEQRTKDLTGMNLRVLRICNLDVDKNFRGVCEYIDAEVQKSLPQSAPLTAPSSEGALNRRAARKIFALGFFDGVHLGHQALLRECRALADRHGCLAGAVTFCTHPDTLVTGKTPALLNTSEERKQLLMYYGMDCVVELPFDRTLMHTHWSSFLTQLTEAGAAGFVCGSDFRFGAAGSGTAKKLAAFCTSRQLPFAVVPQQLRGEIPVSSTHIRGLIEMGDVETAANFLGHPHILSGTVVAGRHLGRTIGVPTANILIPEGVVVPKLGVYACLCEIDGKNYAAVTNIGSRPTVGGHQVRTESWILDFEGDLYGKNLTLAFYKFLRPEQKFASLEELKAQIQRDADKTRDLLRYI